MSSDDDVWQGYDEQGRETKAVTRREAVLGDLHGSSHVWIWQKYDDTLKFLLQKRSQTKRTWPGFFDISAAGHIDYSETPLVAALRETNEELGLELRASDLQLLFVHRAYMNVSEVPKIIENEFRWVYGYEILADVELTLQSSEVESTEWVSYDIFKQLVRGQVKDMKLVPQGDAYFSNLFSGIDRILAIK
jgi:isopentenyldiphosphate isomerase